MLRLTAHSNGDEQTTRYTLSLDKANYGGSVWNLTLERQHDAYTFSIAEEQGAVTPMQVWETVGAHERWFTDVLIEIINQCKVSEATAARSIRKAEELGLVAMGEKKGNDPTVDPRGISVGLTDFDYRGNSLILSRSKFASLAQG